MHNIEIHEEDINQIINSLPIKIIKIIIHQPPHLVLYRIEITVTTTTQIIEITEEIM